jgi:hypothetical protein
VKILRFLWIFDQDTLAHSEILVILLDFLSIVCVYVCYFCRFVINVCVCVCLLLMMVLINYFLLASVTMYLLDEK